MRGAEDTAAASMGELARWVKLAGTSAAHVRAASPEYSHRDLPENLWRNGKRHCGRPVALPMGGFHRNVLPPQRG
jgi:hypothetical protein